jgi:hypothetical protein
MPLHQTFPRSAATLVLLSVVACDSNSGQEPPPAAPESRTLAAPSPTADPRATAIAAYRGMWTAYDQALKDPRPDDPTLSRYATGAALWTLLAGLQATKNRDQRGTGPVTTAPVVTRAAPPDRPSRISIQDCLDTTHARRTRPAPGKPHRDTPGGRRLCQAEVQQQIDGSWKVLSFSIRPVGSCD